MHMQSIEFYAWVLKSTVLKMNYNLWIIPSMMFKNSFAVSTSCVYKNGELKLHSLFKEFLVILVTSRLRFIFISDCCEAHTSVGTCTCISDVFINYICNDIDFWDLKFLRFAANRELAQTVVCGA